MATFCIAAFACSGEKPAPPGSVDRPATVAATPPPPSPQRPTRPWWEKDFGVGVVRYAAMYRYEAEDVIRRSPSPTADTIAVLRRDSLCFTPTDCVRSYGRMIEFDYEVPGWAILGFTDDSAWARVSLAPTDSAGPTGWVSLRDDSVRALRWSRILPTKQLFFMRPGDLAFYSAPTDSARLARDVARKAASEDFDYIMRPLEARGVWLKVELLTPSPGCGRPPPLVVSDTVWIQYLTPEGRPRVFYYTRGC